MQKEDTVKITKYMADSLINKEYEKFFINDFGKRTPPNEMKGLLKGIPEF
jgi:hypothetical protein